MPIHPGPASPPAAVLAEMPPPPPATSGAGQLDPADDTEAAPSQGEEPAVRRRTVEIERGDTLSGVLSRAGVAPEDGRAALEALRTVFDPRSLRPGGTIEVALAADAVAGGGSRLMAMAVAADARREATRGPKHATAPSAPTSATSPPSARRCWQAASSTRACLPMPPLPARRMPSSWR